MQVEGNKKPGCSLKESLVVAGNLEASYHKTLARKAPTDHNGKAKTGLNSFLAQARTKCNKMQRP